MKHRVRLAAGLSAFAIAGLFAIPATANPGLLHKHGARPVGVPAMLPGQSPAGGVVAATAVAPSVAGTPGSGTSSSIGVVPFVPGADGSAAAGFVVVGGPDGPIAFDADGPGVAPGQLPICVMPPPDGGHPGPHGGPQFWHHPNPGMIDADVLDAGMVDAGMVMIDGPTGGLVHHSMNVAVAAAASGSTSDTVGSSGRALAGGLPNRAAGVRTDSLGTIRHHGHGPVTNPAGIAVSGEESHGRVVQAGGGADDAAGNASRDRQAKLAAPAVAGQAAVPAAATAAPRWRDRLRFAWPTAK